MIAAFWRQWRKLLGNRTPVYGINRRNVELVYAHNERGDYPMADDKVLCKEVLEKHGVPIPRSIVTCSSLYETHSVFEALAEVEAFVVKPANSSGGNGIVVIKGRKNKEVWRGPGGSDFSRTDLERHVANIVFGAFSNDQADKAIVEELIHFHPVLQELSGGGGDLRVLTLKGRPFQAMLRLPTEDSGGRANLHQGAIGVAVNLTTGVTGQAQIAGQVVKLHPDTGLTLSGVQLPHWEKVLETTRAAAKAMPLGYLGIDILMCHERGPLVVEVNARPGLEIQNVNGLGIGLAIANAKEKQ